MSTPVLLITGGSGYLGRHLAARAVARGRFAVHVTCHDRPERIRAGIPHRLDVRDRRAVLRLIADLSPQAIIHTAAANTNRPEALMMPVNRDGSRHVAEGAARVGARLVHLSTDALHDGLHAPYADNAPPSPITPYGRSKVAAEAAVLAAKPDAVLVRTSLIYGLREMDRGTTSFVRRLRAGQTVTLFCDQIRQPIWVETLSEALLRLALEETAFAGTLNIAGRQSLSREAFGRRMLARWGVAGEGRIRVGRAADLPTHAPLDLRLTVAAAESLLGMTFPGVDAVLEEN